MKLAQIILPEADNKGEPLLFQHQKLKSHLLSRWGGFTSTAGSGGWLRERDNTIVAEPVQIYSVAMERADVTHFRELARQVARDAGQECVMIVTPNGDVEFVKPKGDE